jgi:hypothetical protein
MLNRCQVIGVYEGVILVWIIGDVPTQFVIKIGTSRLILATGKGMNILLAFPPHTITSSRLNTEGNVTQANGTLMTNDPSIISNRPQILM